jgi:hypothetical protein
LIGASAPLGGPSVRAAFGGNLSPPLVATQDGVAATAPSGFGSSREAGVPSVGGHRDVTAVIGPHPSDVGTGKARLLDIHE